MLSCSKLRRFSGVGAGVYHSWWRSCRGRATNARGSSPRHHYVPKSDLPGARCPTAGPPANPRRRPWTYQQQLHQRRGIYRLPRPGPGACRRCLRPGEPSVPSWTAAWATHGVSAPWRAEDRGHRSLEKQIEGAVSSSWAALAAEEDSQGRGIGTLLVEAGAGGGGRRERGGGGRGGGGVGQREQWEDPMATQSDREIEQSQTNQGVRGVCMGVVPRVQSKLSRALHADRGKKLLQDLQTQESAATKRAIVRFRGAREKGAMAFVECLGFSQEDTMEGPLWRETLGRSLGSHDATELVGGMCHGNGCRQETIRLHAIFCSKTGWSSLTQNRVLHQALARSLRESKVQFVIEDTWPFRQRASEQNGRLNPLRMDITTEVGALFDNHPRLKNKALLLDIAIFNPCAGSNLGNSARHVGKHFADAVERKKNEYRGSFPATYSLLPLALSTCGDVGSDVHALIRELAIRRVKHRSETYSNESQHLAEGTEVARLRRRFSFALQQVLSFRTRHHLCRQGVALASTRRPHSQGPASVQAHRPGG